MNEKLLIYKNKAEEFWKSRSKEQKGMMIGSIIIFILLLAGTSFFASRVNLVPLYTNLSVRETGQIKETLDSRGVKSELGDGGTAIYVPEEVVDSLKVELAAEGIPDSGTIDYSFFGENAGFGMTDNEFKVLKLEATQTELAGLLKGMDGVEDAKVMITLPEQSIWVTDKEEPASASIVLHTQPGYSFKPEQIKAMYHLASKSVPSLPTDNIVITNQFFEDFSMISEKSNSTLSAFEEQHAIKKQIEHDIQREVQRMLSMMMGPEKVVVSVSTDIDFTKENRQEELVEPVDKENMEGLAVSVERITETFTGNQEMAGGTLSGSDDIETYQGEDPQGTGDYERIEERINNDVNRIRKEITESPYTVRDVGIQVVVEPPVADNPSSLPPESVNDIKEILNTIIRTTIQNGGGQNPLTKEEIENKIYVSVQQFNGKAEMPEESGLAAIPLWAYAAGAALLLALIGAAAAAIIKSRRRNKAESETEEYRFSEESYIPDVPDVNVDHMDEGKVKRSQLERMAKEQPEEFAKLLRTWLSED